MVDMYAQNMGLGVKMMPTAIRFRFFVVKFVNSAAEIHKQSLNFTEVRFCHDLPLLCAL